MLSNIEVPALRLPWVASEMHFMETCLRFLFVNLRFLSPGTMNVCIPMKGIYTVDVCLYLRSCLEMRMPISRALCQFQSQYNPKNGKHPQLLPYDFVTVR